MYKEDTDEWMGDIEYLKVFTIEGNTTKPLTLYRKLSKAANKLIAQVRSEWFMFNVTDQKRADIMSVLLSRSKAIHAKEPINTFICIKIRLPRSGMFH